MFRRSHGVGVSHLVRTIVLSFPSDKVSILLTPNVFACPHCKRPSDRAFIAEHVEECLMNADAASDFVSVKYKDQKTFRHNDRVGLSLAFFISFAFASFFFL